MASESRNTVLVALGANAGIGVVKLAAGLLTGSSAMLAGGMDSDRIEAMAAELDEALRAANPAVRYVFLDPTSRHERPLDRV